MVFSSIIFLWVFFPIVFVVNFFIRPKYSNLFLLVASLFFYAWGEPYFVIVMIASIIGNWFIAQWIFKRSGTKQVALFFGIIFNLGILGYFKYAVFGVRIVNMIFRWGGVIIPLLEISLPIGISFFTFQAMSYIIDVYRGDIDARPKIANTALYISFFPQLIAGPIVKYKDISQQIENRVMEIDKVALGFRRFIYGLGKKVLVSNVLGLCADTVYSYDITTISGRTAWIGAIAYTFQIYYDFSGYSDMAIGMAQMFGFTIPENFDYPYMARSINEFWRRWHISLGSWFREYVYIPLGGNQNGRIRTCLNLTIVFFLTGLWHGANFTFIIWGIYNGFFAIVERTKLGEILEKHKVVSWMYCFLAVNFGWVFFRSNNVINAFIMLKRMILPWKYVQYNISIWNFVDLKTLFVGGCALLGAGLLKKIVPENIAECWRFSVLEAVLSICILVLSIAAIAGNTYNPFIYFQF